MASPNNTLIGLGQFITDQSGNVWSIGNGQVTVNGAVDPTTANVTHLAYANGVVWQENADNLWWSKTSPTASWQPTYGTVAVPVPIAASHNNTIISAVNGKTAAALTDASGNTWSIANGQVVLNGAADPTTANVTHLAYANGQIWQENASDLWWSKTTPASAWGPVYGTATVPVPVAASADETVIGVTKANSGVAITDQSDNIWRIVNGQVVVNGAVDATTANVVELAYVGGRIWQQNTAGLWWSKAAPIDGWGPTYGTPTNPIQNAAFTIGNTANQPATTIDVGQMTQSLNVPVRSVQTLVTTGVAVEGSHVSFVSNTGTTQLVIDGDSTITASGSFSVVETGTGGLPHGPLQNNGTMTLNDSTLNAGLLTGTGSIVATNGSTVNLDGHAGYTIPTSETIRLQDSHLGIHDPLSGAGSLSFIPPVSMDISSSIELDNVTANWAEYDPTSGDMSLWSGGLFAGGYRQVADLKIPGATHVYAQQTSPSVVLLTLEDSGHSLLPIPHT